MYKRQTLICGFPGETEEIFQEMKECVREQRFDRLGCFTYSHEENTTAFELEDNVPQEVKERRVEEIMELQSQISWEKNQEKIGKVFRCIFDRKEGNYFVGRTEFDSPEDVYKRQAIFSIKFSPVRMVWRKLLFWEKNLWVMIL